MAVHGYPNLIISLDGNVISGYVTAISGWNVERITEEITGAGDSTDKWAALGFLMKNPVTLSGPFNDVTDGLVDTVESWADDGSEVALVLTFDGVTAAHVATVNVLKGTVNIAPSRGALTQYEVTLRPTGAIT
jgi:hypothetical protein